MRLIACLIEVTAHYGAVYCKLYEHQDAESYCFGRSASSQAHVGIAGALWGGQEGQWLQSSTALPRPACPRAASSSSAAFPSHRPPMPSDVHEKKMTQGQR